MDDLIDVNPLIITSHTALLQTCTQIRSEASQLFYANDTFKITWTAGKGCPALKWIDAVGKATARPLRVIRVELVVPKDLQRLLGTLTGGEFDPASGHNVFRRRMLLEPNLDFRESMERKGVLLEEQVEFAEPVVLNMQDQGGWEQERVRSALSKMHFSCILDGLLPTRRTVDQDGKV